MKYVVVAGGSGGHIYPALSIINKIKSEDKDSDVLYIGTSTKMEKDIVPKAGIPFKGLDIEGLDRHRLFHNFKVFKKYRKGYKEALNILREFKPDIVIGVGGYITLPVLNAAYKLGIPSIIHEQNSIPGLSNKLLIKKVKKICVSLPGSVKYFPEEKCVYTGNPRSEEIINVKKINKSKYGFDDNKKLVIFVMGSLGSITMTNKIKELIPAFKNKNYQVLVITGKNYIDNYKDILVPENVKLLSYCEDLINLMKDSDLLVSRAGASTIAEVTSIGLPTILVPSPYVTHNHQMINAKELESDGAAIVVSEDEFNANKIINTIDKLFDDKKRYEEIHNNSLKLGIKDSSSRIYDVILKVIGDNNG